MKRWWSIPARWLLGGALLVVACDVIENRKFELPPGTPIGPAPDPNGYGGYPGTTPRGMGGTTGFDAGNRCSGITTDYCVATCYAQNPPIQPPICDASTGGWICPPGLQFSQSCPFGSCGNPNSGYCCAPQTGTLSRPPCNTSGFYDACPTGSYSTSSSTCFITPTIDAGSRDTGMSSSCLKVANQACSMQGAKCNDSMSICFCQPVNGTLVWNCANSGPTP